MNRFLGFVAAIAGGCLFASCSSHPLAGRYQGPLSEAVMIEHDGKVMWQPPKKISSNSDNFRFLGMLTRPNSTGGLQLVLPSSSPYIGTAISVSDEKKTLVVDWVTRREPGSSDIRSVRYKKE